MISPLVSTLKEVAPKPGSATKPLPGVCLEIVDDNGKPLSGAGMGKLVITKPWPGQMLGLFRDPERYQKTYWSNFSGPNGFEKEPYYFTGDGARRDEDGDYWILGRVDDVLNVAGHRLGTAEIESALVSHSAVAEAAAVGRPDELKGTAICVFVTLKKSISKDPALKVELKAHLAQTIGAIARPEEVYFTDALPKTRSGKIMRRLLRDIASGKSVAGDLSTIEDLSVLSSLQEYQKEE
jgi:acetyl-CoA synthetase